MPDIQELFRDVTDPVESPPTGRLADGVRTRLRRRRAARLAGTGVAAVAVLAVGVGVGTGYLPWTRGDARTATAAPGELPTLPDSAVGAGLRVTGAGAHWRLTTADGARYRVPGGPAGDDARDLVPLSPGGRWLTYHRGDTLVVRDLTGSTAYRFTVAEHAVAWSPDGRWLVLRGPARYHVRNGSDGSVTARPGVLSRVDLRTGAAIYRPLSAMIDNHGGRGLRVAGVLSSGDVLLSQAETAVPDRAHRGTTRVSGPATYRMVDPAGPTRHGSFPVAGGALWTRVDSGGRGATSSTGGDRSVWRVSTRPATVAPDGRHAVVAEGSTIHLVDVPGSRSVAFELADVHGYRRPDGVSGWQPVALRDGRLTLLGRTAEDGYLARLTIDVGNRRVVSSTRLHYPPHTRVPTQVVG